MIRAVFAAALLLALLPAPVSAQPACEFKLGFKLIADQIPDRVGQCLENEWFNTTNGNAEQRTTAHHGQGGLLVWRKADNWTAFTDGHWTWVNGPFGIQRRLNSERFEWEADDRAAAPAGEDVRTAVERLLVEDAEEAKASVVARVESDPRMADIRRGIPGARFDISIALPVQTLRMLPGGDRAEVRGDLVVRVRLVDEAGRTLLGVDQTDTTPFVRIAVRGPGGWMFAQGESVLGRGTCSPTHPIKGNFSSSGEMIYHVPGGQFYDRTRPEMCFQSEEQAQTAGFRRSQR